MKKNILLVCLFVSSLILSACQGQPKTPDSSVPANQGEVPALATLVVEETSIPANAEQMYPSKSSEETTTYPAWKMPTVESQALRPPSEANTPAAGRTSLSGLLFAFDISVPLSNMDFVLMPAVITDGVPRVPPILTYGNPEDGDVLGRTDGNGIFYLDDIMPGLYYLVVNYPDHSEIVVNPQNTSEPLLFDFKADTSYPLGVVLIYG